MYFDSHAHYFDSRFQREFPGGPDALLHDLFSKTVCGIINVGDSLKSSVQCISQAACYPNMYAAVGIHPTSAGVECTLDQACIVRYVGPRAAKQNRSGWGNRF